MKSISCIFFFCLLISVAPAMEKFTLLAVLIIDWMSNICISLFLECNGRIIVNNFVLLPALSCILELGFVNFLFLLLGS